MAKDFPKTGEGGTTAPVEQPDRVGPVAGTVEPEASTKAVEVKLASPEEHAKALGGVKTVHRTAVIGDQPASFELYHQFHAAAAALHGWPEHAHHAGKPIQLTSEDYQAALKAATAPVTRVLGKDGKPTEQTIDSTEAANKGIPTVTDYEPHQPALSPHKGKGL